MAARRLIIVLLVLMGISTVAAILAPPIEERSSDTASESTATAEAPGEASGPGAEAESTLVEQQIDAFGRPEVIGAVVGDRLALTVESPRPTNVQIPALGLLEFAAPGAPARFDLFLREQARYRVERDGGAAVARIEIMAPVERGGDKTRG